MECFTVQSGRILAGSILKIVLKICFTSGSPFAHSIFGNSHRCAFTTPAGRCRTRKCPRCSTMNAMKCRAVLGGRFPRFGNSFTRSSRKAMQSFFNGQILHCGFRGVQINAPSSIKDWLKCEVRSAKCGCIESSSSFVLVLDLGCDR